MSNLSRMHRPETDKNPSAQNNRQPASPEQVSQPSSLAGLPGPLWGAAGDPSIETQAARLNNTKFQTAQRQALAVQLGRVGGNQYLQRVLQHPTASPKSKATSSDLIQRQGERLADREEDVQFSQTQTYPAFEAEVRHWVARRVLSRTGGVHREQDLVPGGSLRGFYSTIRPGQTITLHAHFHSNGFSFRQLTFSLRGEEIVIRLDPQELESEPERPSPPEQTPPNSARTVRGIEAAGRDRSTSPIPREVGLGLAGARAAGIVASGAASEGSALASGLATFEAIAAPIAAIIASFQIMWAVFSIFDQIEGEKAAGMAGVDYVWTIASRVFGEPGASPHQRGIRYAHAMDEYNGTGDIYRDALRAAREHTHQAWHGLSQQHRTQLHAAFSSVNELGDHLFGEIRPHMQRNVQIYADMWHRRWLGGRTFYRR